MKKIPKMNKLFKIDSQFYQKMKEKVIETFSVIFL